MNKIDRILCNDKDHEGKDPLDFVHHDILSTYNSPQQQRILNLLNE